MSYLITAADVRAVGEVTANMPDAKINRCIQLAQTLDVKPAIGDSLVQLLIANLTAETPDNDLTNLYNGCDYTYLDVDYTHQGIKTICAHYTYSRLLEISQYQVTQYGVVIKRTEESDQADPAGLSRLINYNNEIAFGFLSETKKYIERQYPKFLTYYDYIKKDKRGFNIRILGD